MPIEKRTGMDRRSLSDGRRLFKLRSPLFFGPERRSRQDRRFRSEKRKGWIRVSNWSSKNFIGQENERLAQSA